MPNLWKRFEVLRPQAAHDPARLIAALERNVAHTTALVENGESPIAATIEFQSLVAEATLSNLGLQVTRVEDGQQALAALRRQPRAFDLVLMDLQMPGMDGFATARAIRGLAATNHDTPIIALCAAGIVIRSLASLLSEKGSEPPVLAVAEDGSAVVPLLGGLGGVNVMAREIAAAVIGDIPAHLAGAQPSALIGIRAVILRRPIRPDRQRPAEIAERFFGGAEHLIDLRALHGVDPFVREKGDLRRG